MAHVDPGELKYKISVITPVLERDANDHYRTTEITLDGFAAMRSATGDDRIQDGAAQSVDTVQFIVRWAFRLKIARDSLIVHKGRRYKVSWMDEAPWAGLYARIKAVTSDEGEA